MYLMRDYLQSLKIKLHSIIMALVVILVIMVILLVNIVMMCFVFVQHCGYLNEQIATGKHSVQYHILLYKGILGIHKHLHNPEGI